MKSLVAALVLVISGCSTSTVPWARGPVVSESACATSCNAHYDQCPQIFAQFPERAAVECPAEHDNCLKSCETHGAVRAASVSPLAPAAPDAPRVVSSKEAKLRELKHLYDEGLVTDDVYKDRQKAILSEP